MATNRLSSLTVPGALCKRSPRPWGCGGGGPTPAGGRALLTWLGGEGGRQAAALHAAGQSLTEDHGAHPRAGAELGKA